MLLFGGEKIITTAGGAYMDIFAIHVCSLCFIIMVAYRSLPMNDPTNPESPMNYYHDSNIEDRLNLIEYFRAKGEEIDGSELILWPDLWPLLITGATTAACEAAYAVWSHLI